MYIELSTEQAVAICMEHEVLGENEYVATRALIEFIEEYQDDLGRPMSLDPVALRCEFSLYTLNECAERWEIDTSGVEEEDRGEFILDYLRYRTTVIVVDETTVVVVEF